MKIYLVGGAVRDKLLGLPIKERDWVVVGATVDQMLKLGFRQVGKEFPVFLHPDTNEEYALARMERKVNPGYKGFTFDTSPDVSLEEDLLRRDLTINAIAESPEGQVIDPYHGKDDLTHKCLRHVSPSFLEDPVRILRVGRFAARFHYLGFSIAAETRELMRKMVALGEVDALVAERVWKELDRALAEKNPEQFFVVLAQCQALPKLFPTILIDGAGIKALSAATQLHFDSSIVRFSALLHDAPEPRKTIAEICARYRAPNAYRELATLTATHYKAALKAKTLNAQELLKLFNGLDIYRREPRFNDFLQVTDAIAHALNLPFDAKWLKDCALAAKAYPVHELLEQGLTGNELVTALKEKRCEAISLWLKNSAKT